MDAACQFLREQCAATTAPTTLPTGTVSMARNEFGYSLPVDAQMVQKMCTYVDGMCRAPTPTPTPTPTQTPAPAPAASGSGWVILVVLAIVIVVLSK
jgi:hypothetical protein